MSRIWLDDDDRNLRLLNDEHRRNIRIVFESESRLWALTHPLTTIRFIKTHNPHPPGD